MENAAKALLIGAGFLLALMLISLLVMGYNRISSHYEQKHELLTIEQLDKFNKQFQNYNRSDIRGNELISLMNKVIDYNVSQSYQEGTGYEPIKVEIVINKNGEPLIDEFKYEIYGTAIVSGIIKNTTGSGTPYERDRELVAITETPSNLIDEVLVFTDTQLQKLTAEISNILFNENISSMDDLAKYRLSENRRTRGILLRNILNLKVITERSTEGEYDIKLKTDEYYKAIEGQDKIEKIKEIVSQYYQYTQFKRACFECVEMTHNVETGRINGMKFQVQTKEVDGKTIVVFD